MSENVATHNRQEYPVTKEKVAWGKVKVRVTSFQPVDRSNGNNWSFKIDASGEGITALGLSVAVYLCADRHKRPHLVPVTGKTPDPYRHNEYSDWSPEFMHELAIELCRVYGWTPSKPGEFFDPAPRDTEDLGIELTTPIPGDYQEAIDLLEEVANAPVEKRPVSLERVRRFLGNRKQPPHVFQVEMAPPLDERGNR